MKRIAIIVLGLALTTNVVSASEANCRNCGITQCYNYSAGDGKLFKEVFNQMKKILEINIDGDYTNDLALLESLYTEQLEELNKQNKLLEKYLVLLQQQNIQEKHIAFLVNKFNKMQSLINTMEGTK